jgi:hypothetical protein
MPQGAGHRARRAARPLPRRSPVLFTQKQNKQKGNGAIESARCLGSIQRQNVPTRPARARARACGVPACARAWRTLRLDEVREHLAPRPVRVPCNPQSHTSLSTPGLRATQCERARALWGLKHARQLHGRRVCSMTRVVVCVLCCGQAGAAWDSSAGSGQATPLPELSLGNARCIGHQPPPNHRSLRAGLARTCLGER